MVGSKVFTRVIPSMGQKVGCRNPTLDVGGRFQGRSVKTLKTPQRSDKSGKQVLGDEDSRAII